MGELKTQFLKSETLVNKQVSFREGFQLLVKKQSAPSNGKIQPFSALTKTCPDITMRRSPAIPLEVSRSLLELLNDGWL